MGGTSLGILFVRHGASKSFPLAMFRPTMPPMTVRGSVTSIQMNMITWVRDRVRVRVRVVRVRVRVWVRVRAWFQRNMITRMVPKGSAACEL